MCDVLLVLVAVALLIPLGTPAPAVFRWTLWDGSTEFLFELRGNRWTAVLNVPPDSGGCLLGPCGSYEARGRLREQELSDFWVDALASGAGAPSHVQCPVSRTFVRFAGAQQEASQTPDSLAVRYLDSALPGQTRRQLLMRRSAGESFDAAWYPDTYSHPWAPFEGPRGRP